MLVADATCLVATDRLLVFSSLSVLRIYGGDIEIFVIVYLVFGICIFPTRVRIRVLREMSCFTLLAIVGKCYSCIDLDYMVLRRTILICILVRLYPVTLFKHIKHSTCSHALSPSVTDQSN